MKQNNQQEFKKTIRHQYNMLLKQIKNIEEYIESKSHSETLAQQEHLIILKEKYNFVIDNYSDILI